jgi:hypothetical protein
MKITNPGSKEDPAQEGQNRVSEVSMEGRHGPFSDAPSKAIADHDIKTFPKPV